MGSSESTRLTPIEVQEIVLSTIGAFKIEMKAAQPDTAEEILDEMIYILWEHSYFSASFDLIDVYIRLFEYYIYGGNED